MIDLTAAREFFSRSKQRIQDWQRRRNTLGVRGERAAADYLKREKRMHIIEASARNIYGEIDIIAVDREKTKIIFVEVKTRKSDHRGHPAEAVTPQKQQKITRVALAYMRHNNLLDSVSARFDVVAVTWPDRRQKPVIEHFENAFEAVGKFQMFS